MANRQNCRLCLIKQEPTNCKQIYQETYKSENIYNMIKYCLPQVTYIKVSLESVICLQCLEKLYMCYDFVSTCYRNDAEFKINNQLEETYSPIAGKSNVVILRNIVNEEDDNKNELLPTIQNTRRKGKFKMHKNKFKDRNCSGCKNRIFNAKYHEKVQSNHFDCFHCHKRYFSYIDIKKHLYNHMFLYKCRICDKKCRDKYGLNLHLQTHTKQKTFQCPVCEKTFVQSYVLNQHMGIHEPNGGNRCQICNKALSSKYNLKIHMTMHNAKAKPRCRLCDKWFYTKSARDKHLTNCPKENDADSELIEPDFVKMEDVKIEELPSMCEEVDDIFIETS